MTGQKPNIILNEILFIIQEEVFQKISYIYFHSTAVNNYISNIEETKLAKILKIVIIKPSRSVVLNLPTY